MRRPPHGPQASHGCRSSLALVAHRLLGRQPGDTVGRRHTREVGTTSDINPQDPATLQQGGNLRLALTEFPANFNTLHIDGNTGRHRLC